LIDQFYRADYAAIFGPLPDLSGLPTNAGPIADPVVKAAWESMSQTDRDNVSRIYANIGKAIAAYERKIMPGPAKFDQYVEAILKDDLATARSIYTSDEAAGLRLFIGRGDCTNCHNGPLFTNNDFHNTGVPSAPSLPEDTGRAKGIQQVVADEFNCLSPYSDAGKTDCGELRFIRIDDDHDLTRQFKPPSLRNVAERAPYMDAGQFKTLDEVVNHYSRAPEALAGHSELKPLNLSDAEKQQLIAFLKTLIGPLTTAPEWLTAPNK
jgi:cytochrome c peroxidase